MTTQKLIGNNEFHEAIELPWKKCFMSLMHPRFVKKIIDSNDFFSTEMKGVVKNNWKHIQGRTLVDPFRMGKLADLMIKIQDIPGDIAEFGCFKGGTGILMGLMIKELKLDKKIYLFDSFEGLPEPDEENDKGYKKGQFMSDYEMLQTVINELELDEIIFLKKGWFKDTVPSFLATYKGEISLLHIDCDLYPSTVDSFNPLYPKVVEGGIVVFDDFNDGGRGEKKAVLEFLQTPAIFHVGTTPHAYLIKGETVNKSHKFLVKDNEHYYCFDDLFSNKAYLNWLDNRLKLSYEDLIKPFLN